MGTDLRDFLLDVKKAYDSLGIEEDLRERGLLKQLNNLLLWFNDSYFGQLGKSLGISKGKILGLIIILSSGIILHQYTSTLNETFTGVIMVTGIVAYLGFKPLQK